MKKVVGASAAAVLLATFLTGCENKCGVANCDPCASAPAVCQPAKTSARVTRVVVADEEECAPCIAVMPFQCVGDYPESGIIVADALADALATIDGCTVYSPDVVVGRYEFKEGEIVDPIEVGKALDVSYILTGRVTEYIQPKEEGDPASVGVTARLIDVRTGQEIWTAKQYEDSMNSQLGVWTEAVSSDLAQAISLDKPEGASRASGIPLMITPMAMADAEEDYEDAYPSFEDEIVTFSEEDRYSVPASEKPVAQAPAQPRIVPAPVMVAEPGVLTDTPLTARYGSPTLPTSTVGRILDQFEDPNPPRFVNRPVQEEAAEPVVAAMAFPTRENEPAAVEEMDAASLALTMSELTETEAAREDADSGAELLLSGLDQRDSGTDHTRYRYTGANPFADGPARDPLPMTAAPAQTEAKTDAGEMTEVLAKAKEEAREPSLLPIPPGTPAEDTMMAIEKPFIPEPPFSTQPIEPPALLDMSAMAAPVTAPKTETIAEAKPAMEPLRLPEPAEVLPSEDGTFKVTISTEQSYSDDPFDFFGNLSDSLEDMDDI